MHKFLDQYGRRIEELILVFLIILNVGGFLQVVPADFEYIEKLISWTALGYIVYKIDITNILFGSSHKNLDLALVFSYFLLILKNLTAYASASIDESSYLRDFYSFIVSNSGRIELVGFYLGAVSLLLIALYYALKFTIKAPSVMHVIHEEGPPPQNVSGISLRFGIILFALLGFFIIVFNLMMEWIAIAVDNSLVVAGVFFYIFHARRFNPHSFIHKVGAIGEGFYQKFITLFKYKHTLMLGIAGMLVLHLLTEVGNFIIPYLFNVHESLYFSQLGPGHTSLPLLFVQNMMSYTFSQRIGVELVYLLNVVGALMLLVLPAYFWYDSYIGKKIGFPRWLLVAFSSSLAVLLLNPAFYLKKINSGFITGVDILTKMVNPSTVWADLTVALGVGFLVYVLSLLVKKKVEMASMAFALIFFGYYLLLFFINTLNYYALSTIAILKEGTHLFIALFLFIFLAVTVIFYVGGFFIFVSETVKSYFRL